MCKYCDRHINSDQRIDDYTVAYNEVELAKEPYIVLTIGVDKNDDIVMVAYGDYEAVYKPKYCPECGRSLAKMIPTMDGRWVRE